MLKLNPRDIAQLTATEKMSGHIQSLTAAEESYVRLMAHRNRMKQIKRVIDELEHADGEPDVGPDERLSEM